jgi:serine/threonine protein kinase
METAALGSGWGGRVVEGKFPLLEWLGGSDNRSSFFTVLGGMKEAIIQMILATDPEADAYLAQWNFAIGLSHPHLSKVLAAGRCVIEDRELVYVVTERSDASLSNIIQTEILELDHITEIFNPVLSAVSYLHTKGVVHGHINPSKIQFAGTKPRLSVADLLIAGSVRRSVANPGPYDAPEVQHDTVTAAADAWAIGMTMYEVMTQAPPSLDSAKKGRAQVVLPSPFREIVQDCLQPDPDRRCSIENIIKRLDESKDLPPSGIRIPVEPEKATGAKAPIQTSAIAMADELDAYFPTEETKTGEFSEPVIFSRSFERFEEAHLSPFRVMPYAVILLAVIALIAVLVFRGHKAGTLSARGSESAAPKVEESVPEKQTPAPEPPVAHPAEPETVPPVAGTQAQDAPQTETQSVPIPKQSVPIPNQPLPKVPPTVNHAPARRETNGSVAKSVLPDPSPGAFAGKRIIVEVQMRVSVNKDGTVSDVAYVSPGPGNYFARLAERAAWSWEFTPPTHNGATERSVWMLRFYFARDKTDATATRAQR